MTTLPEISVRDILRCEKSKNPKIPALSIISKCFIILCDVRLLQIIFLRVLFHERCKHQHCKKLST